MTKVLAIHGSPRRDKGFTSMLLDPFLDGMRSVGVETGIVYADKIDVKPCIGEFHCWNEEPGVCFIRDDMQQLYGELKRAEILVLATPMYSPLPGKMQNVLNRLCALIDPVLTTRGQRTRACFRENVGIQRIVLVCVSGWWEKGNMDIPVRIAEELAENASVKFSGALLRPHAFLMRKGEELTKEGKAVLTAAKQAGRELIEKGNISEDALEAVSRPLVPRQRMLDDWNRHHD